MSAKVIQLRDFQNPKDLERMYMQTALETQALEIVNVALADTNHNDTAPCEMNPDRPA